MSMTWMTWMTWTKSVNQFSFSPKHVTPSCFGPNLGRNQPNISLQRQVWELQVAALHNLGKDAPVSDSIMATCDDMVTRNLCFLNSTHGDESESIGPTNLTAASMEPDIQRNANVSPKIHIYKNDILRGSGMTWQLVTRNCGWNGGPVYEATPTTGHQHIYTWQQQMLGFLRMWKPHEPRSTGTYCPDSDPFSTFQFLLAKASILLLLRICLCQRHVVPGHHLRSANPPE